MESEMANKRKVEVFSAGCATCHEAIEAVKREACSSCEIIVHDMKDMQVARRAKELGVERIVRFHGRVPYRELPRHLHRWHIAISTQSNDAFPFRMT